MEQLNRVELRGNVGNIRISDTNAGKVARFSMATNHIYKNKEGDLSVETTWHNVVAWENKNFPDLSKIGKGSGIYVLGRLKNTKYTTPEGVEKHGYEVVAVRMKIEYDDLEEDAGRGNFIEELG